MRMQKGGWKKWSLATVILLTGLSACSNDVDVSEGTVDGRITAANLMEAESFWPNIVRIDPAWQPPDSELKRPKTLQGALVRVEADGRARVDLARFGRLDIPVAETDLVERANLIREGKMFKHGANLTLQIAPLLVRSDLDRPGPNPSRGIKAAKELLCIYADPRDASFPALARRLSDRGEEGDRPVVFIPQNVTRADLEFIRVRLQEIGWTVPYVYPERAAVQTERLLRTAPRGPWFQRLTRNGRELESASLRERGVLARLAPIAEFSKSAHALRLVVKPEA